MRGWLAKHLRALAGWLDPQPGVHYGVDYSAGAEEGDDKSVIIEIGMSRGEPKVIGVLHPRDGSLPLGNYRQYTGDLPESGKLPHDFVF